MSERGNPWSKSPNSRPAKRSARATCKIGLTAGCEAKAASSARENSASSINGPWFWAKGGRKVKDFSTAGTREAFKPDAADRYIAWSEATAAAKKVRSKRKDRKARRRRLKRRETASSQEVIITPPRHRDIALDVLTEMSTGDRRPPWE